MNSHEDAPDPLDYPPRRARLEALYADGLLSDKAYARARTSFHDPVTTARLVDLGMLMLGVGLIVVGILYFFAYNWEALTRWERLAGVGSLLIASWGSAFYFQLDDVRGKVSLLASTFFIGVFLATFGQIYQTGADAWQLFAAWSAFALPWTIMGRFQATWALWILVLNTALTLAWQQEYWLNELLSWPYGMMLMALGHLGLFGVRELCQARFAWLELVWGRVVLVCAVLGWSTTALLISIVDARSLSSSLGLLGIVVLLQAPIAWFSMHRSRDIVSLGLVGVSGIVIGLAMLARMTVESLDEGGLLIMGLFTLISFVGLIAGLLHQWRIWEAYNEQA